MTRQANEAEAATLWKKRFPRNSRSPDNFEVAREINVTRIVYKSLRTNKISDVPRLSR